VDATGGSEITIFVGAGTTLSIENLTISGGSWGLGAYRNSNLLLSKVTIEGFTQRGISVGDSSYLGVNDGGVTISGSSGAEFGIYMVTGSSGWVRTATISGTKTGVNLYGGSFLYLYDFAIDAIERGISIHDQSTVLKVNAGVGVIEGTSDRAISVGRASFYSWDPGSLTIQNLNGGRGIDYEQSDGIINNLKMTDFNNTGSGWNPPIRLGNASALVLNNSEVSGETDSNLINVDRSSMLEVNNSNISGTAGDALISAGRQSLLDIENSTISGTAGALIGIDRGSTLQVENQTTLSGTVQDVLVGINHGSGAEISNSTLTLQSGPIGLNVQSSANLKLQNSSLSGPATDSLVNVARLSNAIISNGSTLSQEDTDAPDVAVRNVSFLSVWDSNTSINKVDCNSTGHVSYDEGTVTTVNCD
jgi:hypothetical protein